jgi:hypothetical protein
MATPATPPVGSSATSSLSDWAGGYVTDMLGKAQAVASEPYRVYQGPMTAGESGLQSKVFQGLGGLNFPSNLGQSFSSPMGGQQYGQQPYPSQIPGTGGGMPPPGGFPGYNPYAGRQGTPAAGSTGGLPPGAMAMPMQEAMPDYASMGITGTARGAPTDADWNQFQSMAQYAPGTDMAAAKAEFMGGGGKGFGNAMMGATSPANKFVQPNDPFYQSPEYKQFQTESEGGFGTMDMYDSPNFGLVGSGTTGRGMDAAYEKYKAGMPAQTETPAFNQLDPSVSRPTTPMSGSYGDTPEDFGVPYNPANFRPPPSMDGVGQTGSPQQGGIAGLSLPPQGSQQPSNIAQSYMNPYLQSVLDPQMAELRRQNDITNMQANAKLTGAGAFGGGRQAIMNAENARNLMMEQNKTVGQGYANAYDKAMGQFNTEQGQAKDLANLMSTQGAQQRDIEQQGISADYNEFLAQRDDPMKKTQYLQSMLQGLPISTVSNQAAQQSGIGQLASTVGGMGNIMESLKRLGL